MAFDGLSAGQVDRDRAAFPGEIAVGDVEIDGHNLTGWSHRDNRSLTGAVTDADLLRCDPQCAGGEDDLTRVHPSGLVEAAVGLPVFDRRRGAAGVLVVDIEAGVTERCEILLELLHIVALIARTKWAIERDRPVHQRHGLLVDLVERLAAADPAAFRRQPRHRALCRTREPPGIPVAKRAIDVLRLDQVATLDLGRRKPRRRSGCGVAVVAVEDTGRPADRAGTRHHDDGRGRNDPCPPSATGAPWPRPCCTVRLPGDKPRPVWPHRSGGLAVAGRRALRGLAHAAPPPVLGPESPKKSRRIGSHASIAAWSFSLFSPRPIMRPRPFSPLPGSGTSTPWSRMHWAQRSCAS